MKYAVATLMVVLTLTLIVNSSYGDVRIVPRGGQILEWKVTWLVELRITPKFYVIDLDARTTALITLTETYIKVIVFQTRTPKV